MITNEEVFIEVKAGALFNERMAIYIQEADCETDLEVEQEEHVFAYRSILDGMLDHPNVHEIICHNCCNDLYCVGEILYKDIKFLLQVARWNVPMPFSKEVSKNWEVTISLDKYPFIISKIIKQELYLEKIKILKEFGKIIFDSIMINMDPAEVTVSLNSNPKYEVSNIKQVNILLDSN